MHAHLDFDISNCHLNIWKLEVCMKLTEHLTTKQKFWNTSLLYSYPYCALKPWWEMLPSHCDENTAHFQNSHSKKTLCYCTNDSWLTHECLYIFTEVGLYDLITFCIIIYIYIKCSLMQIEWEIMTMHWKTHSQFWDTAKSIITTESTHLLSSFHPQSPHITLQHLPHISPFLSRKQDVLICFNPRQMSGWSQMRMRLLCFYLTSGNGGMSRGRHTWRILKLNFQTTNRNRVGVFLT